MVIVKRTRASSYVSCAIEAIKIIIILLLLRQQCSAIFGRKSNETNRFAPAEGCTHFRASTLQRHKDCKEDEDAVNEQAMRETFSNTQRHVFREQSQVILKAMRAAYWLVKEDKATVKYDSLLNFLDEVGLKSVKSVRVGGIEE